MLLIHIFNTSYFSGDTAIATISTGPKGTARVAMAAGCAVKQIINMGYILEAQVTYSGMIVISRLVYGPLNELGSLQYIGISLFSVGTFFAGTSH